MSALAGSPRLLDGGRRPSLFKLVRAVLGGEIRAAVVLWIIGIVLTILAIVPLGGPQQWVWLPWQIDGVWALVGAVGWGYLVCTLVGLLVAGPIERGGFARPTAGWLRISIAISGYGGMAVGHTALAHVCAAVIGGAVVIRLLAFRPDGSAREWNWTMPRRVQIATAAMALLLGLSYSATHAFAADGSDVSYGSRTLLTHVGHSQTVGVGLSRSRLPTNITGVAFTGPGAAHFTVSAMVLSVGNPETMIPSVLRHQPGAAQFSGYAWHPTRLPYRLAAGAELWITAKIRLTTCAHARVDTLRLHYTALGISTAESIPLQSPLTIDCRR